MPYDNYERWKTTPIEGQPYLSIIIPAYNEEVRIVPTIGAIASHVSNLGFPWELIVADDGSKDSTVKLVQELGLSTCASSSRSATAARAAPCAAGCWPRRQLLPVRRRRQLNPHRGSQQAATQVGHRRLRCRRWLARASGAQEAGKSLTRKIMSGGLRWIVRTIFRIGVQDTQCGFKMFTQAAAKRLDTAQTIMGFSFDLEILYLAAKLGYRIAEVPVAWIDAPGSKVDPAKEAQRFSRDLTKIKLNDLRGAYANI